MGVNSLPKTVIRQSRGCDLNPGPSAPESSTLTTRLPRSQPGSSSVWLLGRTSEERLTSVAVDSGELVRASALVAVDEVDARAAVLTRVRRTLVHLYTPHTHTPDTGNSPRQTVHTHRASVHQTAKLVACSHLKGCGGNCRPGRK